MFVYLLTNLNLLSLRPIKSSVTNTWPSQLTEEPIPIVGIFNWLEIFFANLVSTHSKTTEKIPADSSNLASFNIKLLSANLPDDVFIFIKEHPDTFNLGRQSWVIGDYSRDLNYYDELKSIKNVIFTPLNYDTLTLIKNSLCVSTISGAAGLEAVIDGKPTILFGSPWYTDCEGVLLCRTHDECKTAINSILENNSVDKIKVNNFLQKASFSVFDYKDNIDYISTKLIEKINSKIN